MSKNQRAQVSRLNRQRQDFLRTFFETEEYEVKEVNGFVLEKHWNGNTEDWEVAIYTKESWKNRADFQERKNDTAHLLSI